MADGQAGFEDLDGPSSPRQSTGGAQTEEPTTDDEATVLVLHGHDHTNARNGDAPRIAAARTGGGCTLAVVTSGMDVGVDVSTTLPESPHGPAPVPGRDEGDVSADDAGSGTGTSPETTPESDTPRVPGRVRRALETVSLHLVAIAGFTVPAVILWWRVWSGHPTSTLTCACGDPAQEVWFMEWPAWAMAHLHSLIFSGAVNVPDGANLLSNTSGTLVGVVLAPITWAYGPVAATNVALTLAPGLSAWACFAAVRPLVRWKLAAVPAGFVYGYSAAMVSALVFGHVSVAMLVVPPLLVTTVHEIVIRQEHSVVRDGLVLGALLVAQFFVSPEIFVLCLLFGVAGLVVAAVAGWRQLLPRAWHAVPALGLALALAVVVLAYPIWFGLAGPQAVTGVLFAIAPLSGVPLSGVLSPGPYAARASIYIRFGGYLGSNGPPPDYVGAGVALSALAALVAARRRMLAWLLVLLAVLSLWLSLGSFLTGAPSWLWHLYLPWRTLSRLPVLKEVLPDQIAPFIALFLAFLLAVGLDAFHETHRAPGSWLARHRSLASLCATAVVTVVAVVPVFLTFDTPLRVVPVRTPPYFESAAPLPQGTVWLTVPFAVSGLTRPMLWQANDGMRFRLAGAALKTPDATGGPIGSGAPGSARRILTDLSLAGDPEPTGTTAQVAAVRAALAHWEVDEVVIAGTSRDPVYASGFLTMALGFAPTYDDHAWIWALQPGWTTTTPSIGASLATCRSAAAAPQARSNRLFMAQCVQFGAGRP